MLDAARSGELVYRAGPFDLESMRAWGADRSIGAGALRHLLVAEPVQVHAKGVRLQGVRISGLLDLESATLRCPLRLDSCYFDNDGPVVFDYATASVLFLTGCHTAGLKANTLVVTRELDLKGATFTGPVQLFGADIKGQLNMRGAQLNGADKYGTALVADGLKVGGGAFLDSAPDQGAFTAAGAVRLIGADVMGQLNMRGAHLNRADVDGALVADGLKVGGGAFLDAAPGGGAFTAASAVRLFGADIMGQLSMRGAQLNGADKDSNALVADGLKVGGGVFLDAVPDGGAFTAAGAVRLFGADIMGELSMRGAHLTGTGPDVGLVADGLKVGGDMLLGSDPDQGAFTAEGAISLSSARVGGSLFLTGADLAAGAGSTALDAEGIQITRKLAWGPAKPVLGQVNLEEGAAAELDDDWTGDRFKHNGYWPSDLRLDGFIYTMIGAGNEAGVRQRLDWIRGGSKGKRERGHSRGAAQAARGPTPSPDHPAFASGPYEQLFKVYQRAGDDTAAREVAIHQRRDQRKLGTLKWYRKLFNWLLDITIGYGYRTWEALVLLAALYVLVLAITLIALGHHGAIVPVPGMAAGIHPTPSAMLCKNNYPCFSPVRYAFDTIVPIINLHQADYWRPDAGTLWGGVCGWVAFAGTVAGWLLVTLAVAGYTGLARHVDAP